LNYIWCMNFPVSEFIIIDTCLKAVKDFILKSKDTDLKNLLLSDWDLCVLKHIRLVLKAFHIIQELASSNKTPTLSVVLPLYEKLTENLKHLKTALPYLAHVISSCLNKIHEYVDKSRSTHTYAFAMGKCCFNI